jgi:acyl-CoA synthetase (AMP-forming)/AMP-acid ligase II
MTALAELCQTALSRPESRQAFEFEHRWYTWGELRRVADDLGAALDAGGAHPGGLIALVARNRPSAIAAFLGLLARGHSIRMVYPFQSAASLARQLEAIQPAAVVADREDLGEPVTSAMNGAGIPMIALADMSASALDWARPPAAGTRDGGDSTPPRLEILTSGTTGPPKPFAISHEDVARHIVANSQLPPELRGSEADLPPALLMFPVANISGIYSSLPPLLAGQRGILLERFTVEGWHDHLLRFRPQVSGMPPAGVQMILDAGIPPEDLACLTAIGTGAAPLDPGVKRAFEEHYGVPILLSYGATEFGGPVTRMTPELEARWGEKKFGSVGRALPGVRLRVIDPDTGEELPPGSEGLLEVISPRIGPGWIRTSDIVVLDADGFLFHRGRADGAIMRGGFKLLPATIEQALLEHPAISQACVVGVPDARLGQVPAAVIEFTPGVPPPDIAGVEAHLRSRLPATHIPAAWRIVQALPRTPSMKVDMPAVRALFERAV